MLNVDCDICGDQLSTPGGLLFSPPDKEGKTQKLHACISCYPSVEALFEDWLAVRKK